MTTVSVSVVIPAFNAALTIDRAIQSIQRQTQLPREIIVVDDASTDNTRQVVAHTAQECTVPIRLVTNSQNVGPGVSRNTGWDLATSDLVAFLDSDDFWHPQKLAIQVTQMCAEPEIVMSCHDRSVGDFSTSNSVQISNIVVQDLSFRDFLIRNRCATPSVLVRRTIRERFHPELRFAEDYHLWLRIARNYKRVRFIELSLVHCVNPAYGGPGLSGKLWLMFQSEIRVFIALRQQQALPGLLLVPVIAWSTMRFLVRLVDHLILGDRIQTVSESR